MLHCNRQNNALKPAARTASKQLKSQCCHCSSDTTANNMSSECCDVIVARSPPMFTAHNSPAELSVLYQNWLVISHKQQSPLSVRRFNSARASNSPTREQDKKQEKQPLDKQAATSALQVKTRKPCLVFRADSDSSIGSSSSSSSSSSDENEPSSPTRRKKKVVFADDRGLSLTQVRLMSEPSNQPPKLKTVGSYLQNPQSALPGGGGAGGLGMAVAKPAGADQAQWRLRFPQPASNYLDFRKRLDIDNVSLENVIVKSADRRIVGTVKVRNLSYDKDVFVRCTRDKWTSHEDTECSYVQNNTMVNGGGGGGGGGGQNASSGGGGGPANIYDTFSFRLSLPTDATFMEFAVCYKSPDFEHWDNNEGRNYGLSVEQPAGGGPMKPLSAQLSSPQLPPPQSVVTPYDGNKQHQQLPPVHYFGALSNKQNWWTTPRDQKKDSSSSAYW